MCVLKYQSCSHHSAVCMFGLMGWSLEPVRVAVGIGPSAKSIVGLEAFTFGSPGWVSRIYSSYLD